MPRQSRLERNFILQQGLTEPAAEACSMQYSALLFQPRIVGFVLLIGTILQSPIVFFVLAALLWWSGLLPRLNPFDAIYNATFARSSGMKLTPAPAPRRFAQCMAGSFALAIALALSGGWRTTAYVLEGVFIVAVAALALGGFCMGSFVFHVLRGRPGFAARTLPWAAGVQLEPIKAAGPGSPTATG